ncbi:MADF domain-containing protein, partial [Aphis craccivora]
FRYLPLATGPTTLPRYLIFNWSFPDHVTKALGATSGNLLNPPEQKEDKESEENDWIANQESVLEPQCSFQQPPTPSLPYPSSPSPSPTPHYTTEMSQSKKNTTHSQPEPFPSNLPNRKRGFKNPSQSAKSLHLVVSRLIEQWNPLFLYFQDKHLTERL